MEIQKLINEDNLEFGIFLFHAPPFQSGLDQAEIATVEQEIISIPVGSKAVRNFIEEKQPYITLHGHIHESARITGEWRQKTGRTWSFSAAHDGPELAVVKFELHDPVNSSRRLIKT
jgi:Icc-related predicted phosphoesterase